MHNQSMEDMICDEQVKIDVNKARLDLVILKYMARRLQSILCQIESLREEPLLLRLEEHHERSQRIVIYRQQELYQKRSFAFVGFISKRKGDLQPSVVEAIQQTDHNLVAELVGAPGILSYSSLELPRGEWCNLVVMDDSDAKIHIKHSQTHSHAAYHLASEYYEWIRLHSGMMSDGLDYRKMQLLKTKFYTFHPGQQRPSTRERIYKTLLMGENSPSSPERVLAGTGM